jgi:hypothetical protein
MRCPGPNHRDVGVVDTTDAQMSIFAARGHVWPADNFVLTARVREAVADSAASAGRAARRIAAIAFPEFRAVS